MTHADVRLAVMKALAGQSPGYAIYPNASAFLAEGVTARQAARALNELHREGRVEREMLEDGPFGGYRLVDSDGGGEMTTVETDEQRRRREEAERRGREGEPAETDEEAEERERELERKGSEAVPEE